VDVATDNLNCGACSVPCAPGTNCGVCGTTCVTGQTCTAGVCTCPGGLTACADSCVDLATDIANGGACGKACNFPQEQGLAGSCGSPDGGICSNGTCQESDCGPDLPQQNRTCVAYDGIVLGKYWINNNVRGEEGGAGE
jgi:hypothetical protein